MTDLTCPTCDGTGLVGDLGCWDCYEGRRWPTLREWDELHGEVERLREAIEQYAEARRAYDASAERCADENGSVESIRCLARAHAQHHAAAQEIVALADSERGVIPVTESDGGDR